MKNIIVITLISLLVFACGNNSKMQENLVGVWEANSLLANGTEMMPGVMKHAQFEFTSDGKFINSNSINTMTENYTVTGNEIHLEGDSPIEIMTITELSATSLILTYPSGDMNIIAKFKR